MIIVIHKHKYTVDELHTDKSIQYNWPDSNVWHRSLN